MCRIRRPDDHCVYPRNAQRKPYFYFKCTSVLQEIVPKLLQAIPVRLVIAILGSSGFPDYISDRALCDYTHALLSSEWYGQSKGFLIGNIDEICNDSKWPQRTAYGAAFPSPL
jgi:hypothetical protein